MSLQSPLCLDIHPSCIIVQCAYLYIDEIKSQKSDILLVCLLSFHIEQTEVIENLQNEWGRNKAISSILYHILSFFFTPGSLPNILQLIHIPSFMNMLPIRICF